MTHAIAVALMEMVVQEVSTRWVKKITSGPSGRRFTKSTVSRLTEDLDQQVETWSDRLRPRYQDPETPNLFDIHWGVRKELAGAGIIPKVGLNATSGSSNKPALLSTANGLNR